MKKIKAVLCDVDGTLVDINVKYSPGIKTLIKKIQDKNVRFSLATGRAYYSSVKRIEDELGIQGIHILNGGGMIFDSINNKTLFFQPISDESITKIIQYLLAQKLIFALESERLAYMPDYIPEKFKGKYFYPEAPTKNISEFNYSDKILKVLVFSRANKTTELEIDLHIKNMQKNCSDVSTIKFKVLNYFGTDITSEKATKHTAVLEYLKILNLSPDEVVAIGDGPNDYPLFTACGFGIAMATAPKELKEIAGLIVPSVSDDGMIEALEYIDRELT